jgi:hypothetical protein
VVAVLGRDGIRNIRFFEVMKAMTAHRFLILPPRMFFAKVWLSPPNIKSLA